MARPRFDFFSLVRFMYILKSELIDRCQEMQNIINVSAFFFPFLSLKEPCKVEELDIIISDGNCVREWSYSRVTAQQSLVQWLSWSILLS